ncbi:MAG: hypothetical protein HQ402_03455 [Parcubacteria group bacterium]|nr:hypothetical protein [Parcubacteria group bacterium]
MGGLKKNIDEGGKEKAVFKKRNKETVASFPPLNARALAMTVSALTEQLKRDGVNIENTSVKLDDEEFHKLISSENFSKIYAQFLIELPEYSTEGLKEIRGKWVKYEKNSDPAPLVKSLEGYPLEWCTANPDTAKSHLAGGDFYVYYSLDNDKKPTIPRLAIRMKDEEIAEDPRGIAPNQNLDPYIAPVLEEKLKGFGGQGERYKKKSEDMKLLTSLEQKHEKGEQLTKQDLIFLYEINSPIEGFGYQRDPRIEELRAQRNIEQDMLIIFECAPHQIAHNPNEIRKNTKAYVGEWNMEAYRIIKNHPSITNLYESFPDKKIFMYTLETDPSIQSPKQAEARLKEKSIYLSDWGKDILYKTTFSKEGTTYELVQFTVAQLGFSKIATTDEIYAKTEELGLELCPAEVGLHLRLKYPGKDWKLIAMKQITDRYGYPGVFHLYSGDAELVLNGGTAYPDEGWRLGHQFVFLSRKLES